MHIPVRQQNSTISDKELPAIRNKYKFLKIIVIDEISMINYKIFEKFHLSLCKIKESDQPFGGVSVIAVGDLFQLPPVAPDLIYASRVGTLSGNNILEFFSTSRNCSTSKDPSFAMILNRVREGNQTPLDCI